LVELVVTANVTVLAKLLIDVTVIVELPVRPSPTFTSFGLDDMAKSWK
jgi:hypothetical protein